MEINLTKKATEHSMENMETSEGCGCGCGSMTTLTATPVELVSSSLVTSRLATIRLPAHEAK
jgi:hypothetical protein